ncbi:MAG: choice-of-anchor D domain-containing protein [Terriglobales bacterium]
MKKLSFFALLLLLSTLALSQAPGQIPLPGGTPDYFGVYANYANSPLPLRSCSDAAVTDCYGNTDCAGLADATVPTNPAVCNGPIKFGGIRKFVDPLPNLTIATPFPCTYSGLTVDCYEIELREYTQQMHSSLPPTKLRGYVQVNPNTGQDVAPISYLGPVIVAQSGVPIRVTFRNKLPTGSAGDLFIPVDTTIMGAGPGPLPAAWANYPATPPDQVCKADPTLCFPQNRGTLHLHGGTTPWISDGTTHQWITPAGENPNYPHGVSVYNVPDMPDGGPNPPQGVQTFYYTNQQSGRLMFYHDHASGITRLNVYAGEAAGYLLVDPAERNLTNGNTPGIPAMADIPLVIQDKTFVWGTPPTVSNGVVTVPGTGTWKTDPTWDVAKWGGAGNLWFPHVYMPNQNPYDVTGANPMGRWDYGPWFWPPFTGLTYGEAPNPYFDPTCNSAVTYCEPPFMPGTPNPSNVPEAFMDTPVVNGMAYPYLTVPAGPVRFRILSVGNDRFFNLSLWVAADNTTATTAGTTGTVLCNGGVPAANCTEVKMVPFNTTQNTAAPFPAWWYDGALPNPFDDRVGGVPDPATRGPAWIQIGTEGGILPAPAVIRNQPVHYVMNRRDITVGNVLQKSLFLGPAERADVIVDFTPFAGQTLILYNDAPAPVPAADPRLDYFTGAPDMTDTGGAPTPQPGYGPNTRTVMQIRVAGSGGAGTPDYVNPTILSTLQTKLPQVFSATQDTIIVPQAAYAAVPGVNPATTDVPGVNLARIQDAQLTFTPVAGNAPVTLQFEPKSIIEDFQMDYGRMNALLGVEIKHTNVTNQTSIIQSYNDPATELVAVTDPFTVKVVGDPGDGTQLWKITHNGVDTHAVHFHMFNVQIVNRVGWDGAIRGPDPNELGFKDTVRMNPLEDIIVAVRPVKLNNIPFAIPNSFRPLAPQLPLGSTLLFTNVDPNGNPIQPGIQNAVENFGWEYVWHCHLLGHEENDMMRALIAAVPPEAPTNLSVGLQPGGTQANVSWTDNSLTESSFTVQRSVNNGPFTTVATLQSTTGPTAGSTVTYTDTGIVTGNTYGYQVFASNTVGSTVTGYPQLTVDSAIAGPVPLGAIAPTTTAINAPSITYGQNGVVTVSVTSTFGTVTGNVTLAVDGGAAVSQTLAGGSATFNLPGLAAGSHNLDANYAAQGTFGASSATGTLAVSRAPVTITASSASMTYGGPVPAITPIFSGFVLGETSAVLSSQPVCSTTATSSSPVGSYLSSCAGAAAANYTISYVAGVVTVNKAGTTIVITSNLPNPALVGQVVIVAFAVTPQFGGAPAGTVTVSASTGETCTSTVAGGSCTLTFATAGVRTLTATYGGNADFLTSTSAGVSQMAGAIRVNPTSLAFGNVALASSSPTQAAIVTNVGAAPVAMTSVTLGGANAADFLQSNNCPAGGTLAAGASCQITVLFRPRAIGARSATISIADADPTSPQTILLTGTGMGPIAAVSPTSINFGSVPRGQLSAPKTVTVTNNGNAALTFVATGAFTLSGTNPTQFVVTPAAPCANGGSLAPGASCSVTVVFAPAAGTPAGTRNAILNVRDNAIPSVQSVYLVGTAQ